tara:strand:+ start:269 stop:373 length:105 start_codon:yes stop_codon:yes gene_type:complete
MEQRWSDCSCKRGVGGERESGERERRERRERDRA